MKKPPPKKANPIEPLLCNHCDHRGLRYQGSINRPSGPVSVYKCEDCGRRSQNPSTERKAKRVRDESLCPYHGVPRDYIAMAYRATTMPWRVDQ